MAKFPEPPPPAIFHAIGPDIARVPAGTSLYRLYRRRGRHTTEWNTFREHGPIPTGRFDHHAPPRRDQERAISYVASSIAVCIAEVFQSNRRIDRSSGEPWIAGFELAQDLDLLDLCGLWPTRARASQAISSSPIRNRAQRWSRAIYSAYSGALVGVHYASSMHAGNVTLALYESAAPALPDMPTFSYPLAHPALDLPLARLARRLNYALLLV